ncbi:DUF4873 domain-containing protein [Pseudonocardia kunmingensis]|uniref:Uncharacterized protein DUF4873 n=1 Tax=Pseudonocardia kunmingensis TaxID=630975 RepID=A0A543CYV9_9PSEU|nr:DUF4873 domain-containing protein [Pseudonocardia kunmingensis]TQM02283.1 uncharacterized protein DUF4873 [Pseudonocardia kunmingensis]
MADDDEGYTGPAVLTVGGRDVPVHARLDARHEPQDGRLHWFGRVRPADDAGELPGGRIELRTDGARAEGRLGEVDPWGRYRVTGVGRPPFALDEPDLDD